jgi:hypothetical protein
VAEPKQKSPGPEKDQAPKRKQASGGAKRAARKATEVLAIREGLTELLIAPAMGGAALQDPWLTDHITERGPALAQRIAAECERNDRLRKLCYGAVTGGGQLMLALELAAYVGLPLMHFGVIPGAEGLGVPRFQRPGPPPPQAQPFAADARQAPPAGDPARPDPAEFNGAEAPPIAAI